jgi:hypothetical protein
VLTFDAKLDHTHAGGNGVVVVVVGSGAGAGCGAGAKVLGFVLGPADVVVVVDGTTALVDVAGSVLTCDAVACCTGFAARC